MNKEELFQFMEEKTAKMVATCRAKNNDYSGTNKSPFANFEMIGHQGGSVEWGFLTRISDKFSRICSFAQKVELQVKDESVEDSLIDLANYALLFAAYIKHKKDETKSNV
jgi:hypothetical protein